MHQSSIHGRIVTWLYDTIFMEFFQTQVLKHLQFKEKKMEHYTLYSNPTHPDHGCCYVFQRDGCYSLTIGNYTIPENFSLTFDQSKVLIHFGIFYTGATLYQIEDGPLSSSMPSSFFTVEQNLHGVQHWKKGDHYYGIEVIIYETYLNKHLKALLLAPDLISKFQSNYTYRYLPEPIYQIIEEMGKLGKENRLSPLLLESKILECLAYLELEVCCNDENKFLSQMDYGKVWIGKSRCITLTISDIRAVQKAHEIIRLNAVNPPTIMQLAASVGIHSQRLKAVFRHHYRMTIGAYITSIRMSSAERLLTTTQMSVEDIARQVGYQQSANFARMFRKTYGQSPNHFRNHRNQADNRL